MAGKSKSPDEISEVLAMRACGYSVPAICEKTGIPSSTVKRFLSASGTKKGVITADLIANAKEDLLSDTTFTDDLKAQIQVYLLNELAALNNLRDSAAIVLEEVMAEDTPATYKARAIAALTVSNLTISKTYRTLLAIDNQPIEEASLPQLYISQLTDDDIQQMRQQQIDLEEMTRPVTQNEAIIEWD